MDPRRTRDPPEELHGLNYDQTVENPFPLRWSPTLARIVAHVLGDGSIHVNEDENVVDVRYHNTDRHLIDRFASDVQTLFGFEPTITERDGREDHHKTKYQVNLPAAVGRLLRFVLETVIEDGRPIVPEPLGPTFVGALFDDEGHAASTANSSSRTPTTNCSRRCRRCSTAAESTRNWLLVSTSSTSVAARTSNGSSTSFPSLRTRVLSRPRRAPGVRRDSTQGADTRTDVGGTQNVGRTRLTTGRLSSSRERVRPIATRRRVRRKRVEGSNRSTSGLRTIRYAATAFDDTIYAAVLGRPSGVEVIDVEEREYDGYVYDLTIDESAPNFAVQSGTVVHNSTRHNTIEKLYDRGISRATRRVRPSSRWPSSTRPRTTPTASSARDDRPTRGGHGRHRLRRGRARGRHRRVPEMLEEIFASLADSREEIGDHLRKSLKDDKRLGPCPECGEDLLVRRSRHGSYFVGCDGYPDCEYTLPLPSTGKPLILDDECEEHGLNEVKMLAGRQTFVHGCPLCKAEAGEGPILGDCPECRDSATSGTSRDEGGETADEHGGELAIKTLQSGSRLVGCTRYPDCEYSLPLPAEVISRSPTSTATNTTFPNSSFTTATSPGNWAVRSVTTRSFRPAKTRAEQTSRFWMDSERRPPKSSPTRVSRASTNWSTPIRTTSPIRWTASAPTGCGPGRLTPDTVSYRQFREGLPG